MKNEHLVPVIVQDLVNKLNDKSIGENEKFNILVRLETILVYVSEAVNKASPRR